MKLEEPGKFLQAVLESSSDPIIRVSVDGTVTSWNPAAERSFGLSAQEICGHSLLRIAHPSSAEQVRAALERAAAGEHVDPFEAVQCHRDGREILTFLTVSPIRDDDGNVSAMVVLVRDITLLRRSEGTEALLAAIVASSDDAIISKDLNGIVTSWNTGAERVFGYSAREMIGQPIRRIAPPGRENDLTNILEQIRAGNRVDHYETVRRHKDGREIAISLTVSPVRDGSGKIVGASKVARDISRQKQSESALIAAEKLAVIGRMASSIAHEINNPLEGLTNLLYLLGFEQHTDQGRKYLAQAQQELARVSHITAQVLSFRRESPGTGVAAPGELMESALSLHLGRINTSGVVVKKQIESVSEVACNPVELRQVLTNLISNALDAMPRGGNLYLRIHRATDWASGKAGVRILVADTGCGMSAEARQRMFEPFFTTKTATGTGLGLWITQSIVEKYNGRISVRSRSVPGRSGTIFSIFLEKATAQIMQIDGESSARYEDALKRSA